MRGHGPHRQAWSRTARANVVRIGMCGPGPPCYAWSQIPVARMVRGRMGTSGPGPHWHRCSSAILVWVVLNRIGMGGPDRIGMSGPAPHWHPSYQTERACVVTSRSTMRGPGRTCMAGRGPHWHAGSWQNIRLVLYCLEYLYTVNVPLIVSVQLATTPADAKKKVYLFQFSPEIHNRVDYATHSGWLSKSNRVDEQSWQGIPISEHRCKRKHRDGYCTLRNIDHLWG